MNPVNVDHARELADDALFAAHAAPAGADVLVTFDLEVGAVEYFVNRQVGERRQTCRRRVNLHAASSFVGGPREFFLDVMAQITREMIK